MPKRKQTTATVRGAPRAPKVRRVERVTTVVQAVPAVRKVRRRRVRRSNEGFLPGLPMTSRVPRLSMREKNIVVRHREMVGTIAMTTGFTVNAGLNGTLQPGVDQTGGGNVSADASIYSWIQPMARIYEKYRIRRMRIIYEPTCNLTTGSGTVAMSVDYDCRDASPASMTAMINQATGVHGPPYKDMHLDIIPQKDWLYTRPASLTTPYDLKTYDYGFLYINTDGGVVGPAGRISVDYEIEFKLPQ